MKGILITPTGEIEIWEFSEPLYKSAGEAVGGDIEIVRPRRLGHPYVMIVNEIYCYLDLPVNPIGSWLYCSELHGHSVDGNIIILKEEGEDLVSIDPEELQWLKNFFRFVYKSVK